METANLFSKCQAYLKKLCVEIPERCVGSEGNRQAVRFFEKEISALGWDTEMPEFDAMDWEDGGATLQANGVTRPRSGSRPRCSTAASKGS